jgi:hypothetical protein
MALPRLLLGALGFPNWGLSYLGENANYSFLAANAGQYWPFALAMVMTVLAAGGLVAGIVVSAKLKREKLQMEQWLFLKEDEPKA